MLPSQSLAIVLLYAVFNFLISEAARSASFDPIGDTIAISKSFPIYLNSYHHTLGLISPLNYQIKIGRGLENIQISTNKPFQITAGF